MHEWLTWQYLAFEEQRLERYTAGSANTICSLTYVYIDFFFEAGESMEMDSPPK